MLRGNAFNHMKLCVVFGFLPLAFHVMQFLLHIQLESHIIILPIADV